MGKNAKISSTGHRKTKAALAAGAVASTVAATAAYRRRSARQHLGNVQAPRFGAGPDAGPGATQPL